MTPYLPVLASGRPIKAKALGQSSVSNLFGLTDTLAQTIVSAAEPATRRVIAEERTKFAQALMEGTAASAAALLTFIGTKYFVPQTSRVLKGVGYGASALLVGAGALWALSSLQSPPAPEQAPGTPGAPVVSAASQQAAAAIVAAAEPKVRALVDEERSRLADAALSGLPFTSLGILSAIGTWIFVKDEKKWAKAAGYAAATGLFSVGLWVGLSKEAA
jgi:hypothetical protein